MKSSRTRKVRSDAPPLSFFFALWDQASEHVPAPFLYSWLARPLDDRPARKLSELRNVDFIYAVGSNFIAHVIFKAGAFLPVVLARQSPSYRLTPIQGHGGLMEPEGAERLIDSYLQRQKAPFWKKFLEDAGVEIGESEADDAEELLRHFRQIPWQSLRFDRPLRAGQLEPIYTFRKAGSRCEFRVGVTSGQIAHEWSRDST